METTTARVAYLTRRAWGTYTLRVPFGETATYEYPCGFQTAEEGLRFARSRGFDRVQVVG
jgi:hypothetical protein